MNALEKIINYAFNPFGRLPRLDYAMSMAVLWVIICAAGEFYGMSVVQPLALFLVFCSVCLGARRWHDFNCSGFWWLLRFAAMPLFVLLPSTGTYLIVQIAPMLVLAVECIIPGSVTTNRFGPVPTGLATRFKARRRATAVAATAKIISRPAPKSAKPKAATKKKKK